MGFYHKKSVRKFNSYRRVTIEVAIEVIIEIAIEVMDMRKVKMKVKRKRAKKKIAGRRRRLVKSKNS